MASGDKALERPFPSWLSWIVSLLLIVAVAVLDLFSSAGLVVPVLYVVPLVLGIQQRSQRLIWGLALLCVLLDFVVHVALLERWLVDLGSIAFLNRVLAAAAILVMAAICHALVAYQRAVRLHHQRLVERTASLETANQELAAREEKIVRQNEALQALIETIQQERRRFESAFNTMPFGLAVADDPSGGQVRLNPAGAALLNVAVDENIALSAPAGIRIRRQVLRGGQPVCEDDLPLSRALQGTDVRGDELEYHLSTGRRLVLLVSASPIYDAKGKVAGAISGFVDITAMKDLQRELDLRRREAEEGSVRKTRFLAAISHDIRTPVNAINLLAELVRRTAANPALAADVPELAEKLHANAVSLIELINDLLDVARFDQGKLEFQESQFALNDVIADECRQLAPLAQEKRLNLFVEPPATPITLRTDRIKLARILGNLIGNAIKFTDTGSVRVSSTLLADRRVQIGVADTGIGIASEQMPHIFDEFIQLRNPERDRSKGSGLGLAICKRLTEAMGGSIGVESQPGCGTTMIVTLPAACVLSVATPAPPPPAFPISLPGLAGLRVLVVEDHYNTRQATVSLLEREGARVTEARTGREAVARVGKGELDVVLLDMMLPDMDGAEVLKSIQTERPPGLAGVLVLTGDLTPGRQEEVKRLGADELVAKPIDVNELVARLRRLKEHQGEGSF